MPEKPLKPGWNRWRFEQMAEIVNDRIDNPTEADVDHYVGLEHLDSDSLKIRRWGSPSDVEATKLRFKKGDIIFGRRRVYQRKLAVAEFDGICSAHAMVLRARPEVVRPDFLPFFMQSDLFMERARSISVGSLSPTINWRSLAKQEFALPPSDEQRELCTRLLAIEQSSNRLGECLVHSKRLVSAIRTVEFDPLSATTKPLAAYCGSGVGIQIGPFGAQLHQSDYVEDGIPVIMPADMIDDRIDGSKAARITEEKAAELHLHRVREGDIILPRRGELNRRARVAKENIGWLCGTGSIRIRLEDRQLSTAIFHSLSSPYTVRWLRGNAVGTTMPNLNTKIVSRISIALPEADRLEQVVQSLEKIDKGIGDLKGRADRVLQIKKSILETSVGR